MNHSAACRRIVSPLLLFGGALTCGVGGISSSTAHRAAPESASEVPSCRVAVCFSGQVRSLVYPVVSRSIRRNLIDAIAAEEGCRVDVFAYATHSDSIPQYRSEGTTAFTPDMAAVEAAMATIAPTRLVWHRDQAGVIPNSCPGYHMSKQNVTEGGPAYQASKWYQDIRAEGSPSLYWQLYKSLAAYRMALQAEQEGGFTYDWIVRTRFDTAWPRPCPPLRFFSRDAVWFGTHFWPMSDSFALVPRALADRFFNAIKAFYSCDGESWPPSAWWWQPACMFASFHESILFRYLHSEDVPYRHYSRFEYNIARGVQGGVCSTGLSEYRDACNVLNMANAFSPNLVASNDCFNVLAEWSNLRCRALLPVAGMDDARRAEYILHPDPTAWESLVVSPMLSGATSSAAANGEAVVIDIGGNSREAPTSGEESGAVDMTKVATATGGSPSGCRFCSEVPVQSELDAARSRLIVLRDAIQAPKILQGSLGDGGSGGVDKVSRSERRRWDGFEKTPPWAIFSPMGCSIDTYPGRAPHLVTYFTIGPALIRELATAIKCHLNELAGGGRANNKGIYFDQTSCEGLRPLAQVMVDVSLHSEELGICIADPSSGMHFRDQITSFFGEPARHCVGYGRLNGDGGSMNTVSASERSLPGNARAQAQQQQQQQQQQHQHGKRVKGVHSGVGDEHLTRKLVHREYAEPLSLDLPPEQPVGSIDERSREGDVGCREASVVRPAQLWMGGITQTDAETPIKQQHDSTGDRTGVTRAVKVRTVADVIAKTAARVPYAIGEPHGNA